MADINVKQLSKAIKIDLDNLLAQMKAAGLSHKSEKDIVSTEDKKVLLKFIKDSKKDSKKTISLSTSSQKTAKPNLSVTRINSPDKEKKSNVKQDFTGSIDFDEAERKRLNAQNESAEEEKKKAEAKTKVVRKTKQEPQKKIPQNLKKDKKTFKDSSKEDQREQEGEKFLEKNFENVQKFEKPQEFIQKEVKIPETIVVSELAKELSIKSSDLIKSLMNSGVMVTLNQAIDQETAILVVEELGHIGIPQDIESEEEKILENIVYEGDEELRNPVVSVLGHVDHGKTSILDFIRKSSVADQEEGGITQGIGAYQVDRNNQTITFIDTPGHAAFSEMRARGANSTDIVVLVVAADDSVQPQTEEAFNHAKAANVQVIVAVNKIDKPDSDIEKVKGDLSKMGLVPEDWGGDTQVVPVSAKTGEGIDDLIENITLLSEMLELKTNHDGPASGVVLESGVKKGEGAVATLLVQRGTLNSGDFVLIGDQFRKIRSLKNFLGSQIKTSPPSSPVAISGLEYPPNAGQEFMVVKDEKAAKSLSEERASKSRDNRLAKKGVVSLDGIFAGAGDSAKPSVNLIIKTDTNGSAEAIAGAINNLKVEDAKIKIVLDGVGPVSVNDVNLAVASEAVILGFNVRSDAAAETLAETEEIKIQYFGIIYDLLDAVKEIIEGSLEPEIKEVTVGIAEVKDTFKSPKFGLIAGSIVIEGAVIKNLPIRVLRDNIVIHEGKLDSLRRFKDEASEVKSGTECGIGIENYNDVKVGDKIEVFERTETARKI
ncbi:MAG: translation initiation factor IF-2 [Gammaproteobacteria bacterium]|nr:MAG: translation initiation factor IF-2 [Gammaproteobacteria bacterium]